MRKITIPDCLKNAATSQKKVVINSDSIWAFTEQPKPTDAKNSRSRKAAHDLFDFFTASIIRKKTKFIR
jgi:hypothetical protein